MSDSLTPVRTPTSGIDAPFPPLVRRGTGLHEKRRSAAILESKLPKVLLPAEVNETGMILESDAWRNALSKRLEIKNLLIACVAEFVGTLLFLFFALSINTTAVNAAAQSLAVTPTISAVLSSQLYSSLGFGFSLCISAWVFFRISGGVQNPAITLALTLTGALTWTKCIVLTVAQFAAGIAAAGLVSGLLPGTVNARTTLAPGMSIVQGFFLEFVLTCQLIFTVLMLAAEKHKATFLAPVGIGLALFITQLLGQSYTGASVNPARSLGPDAVTGTFDSYCWIYYVASYAAALATSGFYLTLKWVRYETTCPDQDADEHRAGAHRQVIFDAMGNIVGVIQIVDANDYHINDGVSDTAQAVQGEKFQGSDPGHVSNQLSEAFVSEALLANKDKAARANTSEVARAL